MQNNNVISDEELYQLMCTSHKKDLAFKALYNRYKTRVYGYCRKVVGDVYAEDAFQETFVRFYTSAHSDRNVTNVIGFLMTIARNLCLNIKERNEKHVVEFKDLSELDIPFIEDDSIADDQLKKAIHQALDVLADEYREAVYLQIYSGLSYEEIAKVIGKPVSTVRNRIVRAKTKMRDLLSAYFNEHHKD
ncbi:MAG: RNA polymerase sigma factor [Candidatus Kapaibacterium sp.]|nr:RNA polymerase sigma factor [Bacteroidota bacterium]